MRRHRIAVIPGDGVGPEVTGEALRALDVAARAGGFGVDLTPFDLGAGRYLATGQVLPEAALEDLSAHDAIFLGAVGDPRVQPGILEEGLLLRLRQELDLYVNLRPSRLFEGVPSPLRDATPGNLDIVIVRENTEGLYKRGAEAALTGGGEAALTGGREAALTGSGEAALEISVNTPDAVQRVVRYAFALAAEAGRSVTLVHKENVLRRAGQLYRTVFEEVAGEYPGVPTAYQHVDAAALLLVTDPRRFQVIVTDNLFGDILSDLAAGLVGGIGFVGSGNIHPGKVSVFEPVHGSAPDIAGTGRANPIGAILSATLMLRHLGEAAAAGRIEKAVGAVAGKVAAAGLHTREVGELVAQAAA
ncbi:MAG: 3-isopropylmalate dehydrogenase [Actinomycetota bacterium]